MESRVEKYKEYRASILKEGKTSIVEENHNTGTLPIDEVISKCKYDEVEEAGIRKEQRLKVLKYVLLILLLIVLTVGVVLLGIIAFGGNK